MPPTSLPPTLLATSLALLAAPAAPAAPAQQTQPPGPTQQLGSILENPVLGAYDLAVIPVVFPDLPTPLVPPEAIPGLLDDVRLHLEASSYGRHTITWAASGVVALDFPSACYGCACAEDVGCAYPCVEDCPDGCPGGRDLRAEAVAGFELQTGLSIEDFDREVILVPQNGSNISNGLGQRTLVMRHDYFQVISHELGHTYRLPHSDFWQVPPGAPSTSPSGGRVLRGDLFDVMGRSVTGNHHFHPWHKLQLGWLDPAQVVLVESTPASGQQVVLDALEAPTGATRAARLRADAEFDYWVYYRNTEGEGSGVFVSAGRDTNARPNLLYDTHTATTTAEDAALQVPGECGLVDCFEDPDRGVAVRLDALDATTATVTVVLQPGATPDRLPVVDVTAPAAGALVTGTVTYRATAYDPDVSEGYVHGAGIREARLLVYPILDQVAGGLAEKTLFDETGEPTVCPLFDSGWLESPPYLLAGVDTTLLDDGAYTLVVAARSTPAAGGGLQVVEFAHTVANGG